MRRLVALALLSLVPASAVAGEVRFGHNDVASLFHLSKSENRNQVHFAARLDAQCRLIRDDAVTAYWRDREVSESATSSLLLFERPAYDIREISRVSAQHARVALRALPDRPIEIRVERGPDGSCEGAAITVIDGEPCVLAEVFVQLSGWSVDYVIVRAERIRDGAVVQERIHP